MTRLAPKLSACAILMALLAGHRSTRRSGSPAGRGATPAPGPTITVRGHTFTQQSLFQRNIGGPDDMTTQFPPHKVIGNIYYVGTKSLASFLIVTPQGNILINSTYERNVPTIQKSVEQLGFKFADIEDPARQPRARRSSGRRRAGQAADRRAGDGDGRGRAGAARR